MNTWAANDITVNVEDSKLIVTSNNPEKLPLYIMDIQGHILDKSEITAVLIVSLFPTEVRILFA